MAGAFSQHLLNSYYTVSQNRLAFSGFGEAAQQPSKLAVHGAMSFAPSMHGSFREAPSLLDLQPSLMDMSEATAARIAELQAKLDRKLGPEYVSQRPGPGGGPKLTYAEGWKIINLANEIFGFNGWSSSVVNLNVDFIDFNEESKRYTIGVTAIVRVTLRDGVFHEDVGYGMLENSKSKGQALDKCKKEAVTDGVKRALRSFGNVLGNCLYDKEYTKEIIKIKVPPPKFDKDELHRRPEFATTSTSKPFTNNILGPVQQPPTNQNTTTHAPPMRPPPVPQSRPQLVSSPVRQLPRYLQAKPAPKVEPPKSVTSAAHVQFAYTTATEFEDQESQLSESLEFFAPSDDEAMMAAADLASGMGGPIYDEDSTLDAGIDKRSTSATLPAQAPPIQGKPASQGKTTRGRSSRSNAIAAALAAMEQDPSTSEAGTLIEATRLAALAPSRPAPEQTAAAAPDAAAQHPRPGAAVNQGHASVESPAPASPSMGGGFNLPPGFKPQSSSKLPAPQGWQQSAAGMKRPADAMQSSPSIRRPMQGMGLAHQPLPGRGLDMAEGKRMKI